MFCIIVTVVAFFPFCFFMPAFGVHSQRTISWMRLFANITQVFNFFLLFFGAFFLAFSTYSSWRTSRMGRRRCLMRWSWSTSSRRCVTRWSWRSWRTSRRRKGRLSFMCSMTSSSNTDYLICSMTTSSSTSSFPSLMSSMSHF